MNATSASSRLRGKTALITGAARGIGRAVAVAFAREGASVAGLDICGRASKIQRYPIPSADDLAATGKLVQDAGAQWHAVIADIRDREAIRQAVDDIGVRFGALDILAAIAGIQAFKPLLELEEEDWQDQLDVNLTGTLNCIRAVAPAMVQRKAGRIIVTSSTQGRHGMRDGAGYSASKWALLGLMKSAALEFGQYQVTVNAVVPGLIDTALTRNEARYRQALAEANAGKVPEGPLEPQVVETLKKKTPLGMPWVDADDVAGAYVYLASDDARCVTGSVVEVTGGDTAHYMA